MSIETDFVARLKADSTVSGLVGNRIYPVNRIDPQENTNYPIVVYQRISTITPTVLVGSTGLEAARFQISVWSNKYSETKTVANAIKLALDGNNNTTFENEVDDYDADVDVNFTMLDFILWNN